LNYHTGQRGHGGGYVSCTFHLFTRIAPPSTVA
jgi:hypothetical protein